MKFKEIEIDNLMNIIASFKKDVAKHYNDSDCVVIRIASNDVQVAVDYRCSKNRYIVVSKEGKHYFFTDNSKIKMIDMKDIKETIEEVW